MSNPNFVYNAPATWTINPVVNSTTQISFKVTLNSGKYGFKIFDDLYGWYTTTGVTLTVSKSTAAYTLATAVTQTSFNGGVLKINGDYIGDGSTITVNGFKSTIS